MKYKILKLYIMLYALSQDKYLIILIIIYNKLFDLTHNTIKKIKFSVFLKVKKQIPTFLYCAL